MADSKYFGIPFATSGDKATIPEATQPTGAISFTQGFGPDYERDPSTDPLAKRVPRDETNELYFQITNAVKFLQLYGTPEWYEEDDAGNPVSYPLSARVRYDAGAGMQAWRSLVANNTATPGSDPTKWMIDNPFDIATLEATLAEALAGSSALKLITPRRLASSTQRGTWVYAVASGTANALTVTLSPAPAPAALSDGMLVNVKTPLTNTSTVTINVNGLGVVPVVRADGQPLQRGDLIAGAINTLAYDSASGSFQAVGVSSLSRSNRSSQQFRTPGTTSWVCPSGVYRVFARVWGAGGGGGGGFSNTATGGAGAGGSGGGYAEGYFDVTPGTSYQVVVGSAGAGGSSPLNGTNGGASSFGGVISATGGSGGLGGNNSGTGPTGSPGTGTGGTLQVSGNFGAGGGPLAGSSIYVAGGGGGAFGSSNSHSVNNSSPGTFPGGAGGGGAVNANGGGIPGGNGASGFVTLEW